MSGFHYAVHLVPGRGWAILLNNVVLNKAVAAQGSAAVLKLGGFLVGFDILKAAPLRAIRKSEGNWSSESLRLGWVSID